MADKPVVKYKTYRQSSALGGKIYGVPNLADPVIASITMQQVIEYAKLHNYSAASLESLLSQVISAVADLVARDGRPRNLSDLLKFEPTIKGTFKTLEDGITTQKIVVRPRLLKEIRVQISSDSFSWQNENDTTAPRIISVAPKSDLYSEINLASVRAGVAAATGFGWTMAGNRLCPNGWDNSCAFEVTLKQGDVEYHLETIQNGADGVYGYIEHGGNDEATDNSVYLSFNKNDKSGQAWIKRIDSSSSSGWVPEVYEGEVLPLSGDVFTFRFTRTTGSGDTFTVEKAYTL